MQPLIWRVPEAAGVNEVEWVWRERAGRMKVEWLMFISTPSVLLLLQ